MVKYLYIHIPFCVKKCTYCDFNSVPFRPDLADIYVSLICEEIKKKKNLIGYLKTIYIGGGTPTILNEGSLMMIMKTITEECIIDSDAEITVEANPESISEKKCYEILASGINRISIGLQSFNDDDLQILGRIHTSDDSIKALRLIKKAGFNNVSTDFIYGIPTRQPSPSTHRKSLSLWLDTLKKVISMSPEHISIYELIPEYNTPLYNQIYSKNLFMPDENLVSDMYYAGKELIEKNGYVHYEISNFAKPFYECKHNLNYWGGEDYLGIGAGAHSFVAGHRYSNISNINEYISASKSGWDIQTEHFQLNHEDNLKELIFLGLRKIKGIEIKKIPVDFFQKMQTDMNEMIDQELLEINNNYLRLTTKGLILSNEVMLRLMRNI